MYDLTDTALYDDLTGIEGKLLAAYRLKEMEYEMFPYDEVTYKELDVVHRELAATQLVLDALTRGW